MAVFPMCAHTEEFKLESQSAAPPRAGQIKHGLLGRLLWRNSAVTVRLIVRPEAEARVHFCAVGTVALPTKEVVNRLLLYTGSV